MPNAPFLQAVAAGFAAGCLALAQPGAAELRFGDVTAASGIRFTLRHSPTGDKRMIETMPGGLAVFDYDGDGLVDVFFANGANSDTLLKDAAAYSNRLYRNDGGLRFTDVTDQAGVGGEGFSMGASVGDFDNDGDIDLFVAGVFRSFLYRNRGDGTFEDISQESGVASAEWAVAGLWFDYDLDGLLDLFVVNYADWALEFDRYCGDRGRGLRVYCHPKYLTPIANRLYRNLGGGRFRDVSEETGLLAFRGRGMSAASADFDADGRPDLFVTNDNLPNFLFRNAADGTFTEDALLAGVALLDHGRPVASMGVDLGDFDNDGFADLAVTALSNETFPLFQGEEGGTFRDATIRSGLARASRRYAGWGNAFADFDNDGLLDLWTANSHVNDLVEHFEPFPYLQPNTVFPNAGGGSFAEALEIGPPGAHRGIGVADFDRDGRLDVVVTALGEPARLWRNLTEPVGNWVALELVGAGSNRDGLGSRVRIADQTAWRTSARGYASSRLAPMHFGLGDRDGPLRAVIEWPGGRSQSVDDLPVNRVSRIHEPR